MLSSKFFSIPLLLGEFCVIIAKVSSLEFLLVNTPAIADMFDKVPVFAFKLSFKNSSLLESVPWFGGSISSLIFVMLEM